MHMTEELKLRLKLLAEKYETSDFLNEDPSQFIRWYSKPVDIEPACFIASMLAFGNRKQFIPKITEIFTLADNTSGSISNWLKNGAPEFPFDEKKFYRFYSYNDMRDFFEELGIIIRENETLGNYFQREWRMIQKGQSNLSFSKSHTSVLLHDLISNTFPKSKIVPKGSESANKRIHMLLRWLVRQDSPVDIGLWTWYNPSKLLIPLDIHVMEESKKLGLLPEKATASHKTAILLTKQFQDIWPDDPSRGDFALFGLGVDKLKESKD